MISYNYHLVFSDEPWFNSSIDSNHIKIFVKKTETIDILEEMRYRTKWQELSGEKIRYLAKDPFFTKSQYILWAFEVKDTLILFWDNKKKEILYIEKKNYNFSKLLFWLLHTFFPIVLEFENSYKILHVAGVEVEDKPILFLAPSYGGKSTLTNHFLTKGHKLVSDDSVGVKKIGKSYYVTPSHPYYRPYRKVGDLGLIAKQFSIDTKPLSSIYLLKRVDKLDSVNISKIYGIEKFKTLYMSSFVAFDFMREQRFEFFSEMARDITLYSVAIPWDIDRLDDVYNAIIAHEKR